MNVKIVRIFLLCLVFIQITGVAGALSLAEIGSYDTTGSATGVVVSGSYTYVADGRNGLVIVDISNPPAPTLVGSYDTIGYAYDVAVSGNYAYVVNGRDNLVTIIDISNPTAPALVGSYDTAGGPMGIAISGSYAYIADNYKGLVIIDISNPTAPTLVGSYDSYVGMKDVVVSGSYAYVADYRGLEIFDISNPAAPVLVSSYDLGSGSNGVAVSGSYAYVADSSTQLEIVDVSNPAIPVFAGRYDTVGSTKGVAVSDNYAYIANNKGLVIIDISNPAAPALIDSYDTAGSATGVAVSGSYAYVADEYNGLVIIGESTSDSISVSETLIPIPPPTGSISVSSNPSGASVYLDDADKGITPYTITSVSAGSHTIKLTKTGYADITKTVNVVSDGTTSVSETLTLIPLPTGSILTSSNPSGAKVYLDNEYKGTTPLTIESISIGSHALKLVKEGYSDKTKSVIITKDNTEKISMVLESIEDTAVEPTNSIDADTPESDNKKSDAVSIPIPKPDESSSNSSSIATYGGIGLILLLFVIMGISASNQNKSKPKKPSMGAPIGKSIKPIKITSAFGYKGATIQYKVKVENPTSEPIADIKINLYVPDVFLASESTKSIAMLKPSESKTATFEIRPTGECGDCEVSGKVVYYDYSTKKTTEIDIPPKSLSIVCPMLKMKEISESEWHNIVSSFVETEESTREIDMPAETLFTMISRIVKDMHMHPLNPEITNS
ncbi:MAG: PEGA domain-containing protein, partial [Methanosarcinales archaeon]|nr:PEGA domain-containing protein [Methanosarcinales archaeon]